MRNWLTGVLAGSLVLTAIWGYNQYVTKTRYQILLENEHQRAFYNFIGNVENISALTSKSIICGSDKQNIRLLSDVWWQANLAQQNLGQLPLSHVTLTRTEKFLTQLGDYAYTLAKALTNGEQINEDQLTRLQEMHNRVGQLGEDLHQLQNEAMINGIRWSDIENTGRRILRTETTNYLEDGFNRLNAQLVEYPTLIYDGPFSDHLENPRPKALTGKMINWDQAKKIARAFVSLRNIDYFVQDNGMSTQEANIPIYSVRIAPHIPNMGEVFYVDVSQKGGHVVMVMNSRDIGKPTIDEDTATDYAAIFLEQTEYKSMVPTYSLRQDNTVTVTFAYRQGNVIIYPDQIKVIVALDNGQIIGFDAASYLLSHHQRNLPKPKISTKQARKKINPILKIETERLAVIPVESGKEILCYEFKVNFNEDNFLIYINVETGAQEQILKMIETPGGILTM